MTTIVDAPQRKVFDYMADLENLPRRLPDGRSAYRTATASILDPRATRGWRDRSI